MVGFFIYPSICLFSGMSEVSLEAESGKTSPEDPQLDCEGEDKTEESVSEDVRQDSVDYSSGRDYQDDEMDEIDIDSAEENAGNGDKAIQKEDEGIQREVISSESDAAHMSASVENEGPETNHQVETAETPEESGDSDTETKVILSFTLDNLLALALCALAVSIFTCCDGDDRFPTKINLLTKRLDLAVKLYHIIQQHQILFVSPGRCVSDFILLWWRL